MKKLLLIPALYTGLCIITVSSCKKEKVPFTHAAMSSWFSTKCSSCHSSGGRNSRDWEYDASDYNGSIADNKSKLYEVVYVRKSMPPSKLSQADLDQFKAWYDAGCPAN